MCEDLILTIDVGTSVVKALIVNGNGHTIARAAESMNVEYCGLQAELDMETVWKTVARVMRSCLNRAPKEQVAAVGLTAQGDGCWLIDAEGRPTGPAILWNDGRANQLVQQWESDGTAARFFTLNHSMLFPGSQGAVLKWLDLHDPDRLHRSRWALYCKDWVFYRLTGMVQTDFTDASHPFLNIRTGQYSTDILDLLGISSHSRLLPPIATVEEGRLRSDLAGFLGLRPSLPVIAGPFDVVAALIGIGANRPRVGGTVLGTTVVNALFLDSLPENPVPGGMTLYVAPNRWLKVMAVMLGTPNLDWALQNLAGKREMDSTSLSHYLDSIGETTRPGAGGIIYHPYLSPSGERAPFVKPTARAQFYGLSVSHRTEDLIRAVLEGVAYSIRDAYEGIAQDYSAIHLTGGGAQSSLWCQIIADVTGREVVTFASEEAGALGAAINAAVKLNMYRDVRAAAAAMIHEKVRYSPSPAHHTLYSERFKIYREIYRRMWNIWDLDATEFRV
ncbi:MAG TPA: carbohydrate kinase [Alicyclobacillus sp.]|nr:carbohydrate kinase [Alicyclobacillus sp.]